jgi:hypothetical protein
VSDDLAAAKAAFRRFVFDATLKAATHGRIGGLIAARLKHLPVKSSFTRLDRSGRQWASPVHVRTVVRAAMVNTYVDAFLFTLMARGIDKARVTYDEPDHENDGLVFSIDGNADDMPSLDEIRAKVFHPNSTARLEPYWSLNVSA